MANLKGSALAAVCASAVMLMGTLPADAGNAGVNIIYPPKRAADFDKPDDKVTVANEATNIKVYVTPVSRSFYLWKRRHQVNCKLFQYYSFSRRACSGRLYPF